MTLQQLEKYLWGAATALHGTIDLFVILAIIMKASQQIKWYAEG